MPQFLLAVGCYSSHARTADARETGLADGALSRDAARMRDVGVPPSDARPVARDARSDGLVPCPPVYSAPVDCSGSDPRWEPQPGLWSFCPIERARCPEHVLSFRWEPCGTGPVSCERANLHGFSAVWTDRTQSGGHDGSRGIVPMLGGIGGFNVDVFVSTDGMALAAWRYRSPGDCGVYRAAASGTAGAFIVHPIHPPFDQPYLLFHAPVDLLSRLEGPISSTYQALGIALSDRFVATQFNVGPHVVSACERYAELDDPPPSDWALVADIAVVDPIVLWTVHEVRTGHSWFDRAWIRYGSRDRPAADYYVPEPAYGATDMVSDGLDVAWVRVRDLGAAWGEHELWTARYVDDAVALEPRFVATLPHSPPDGARIGGGLYAYTGAASGDARPADTLFVIDLTTGARRAFPSPFARVFRGPPAYVTGDEILFQSGEYLVRLDPRELFATP